TLWNRAMESIYGTPARDVIGKRLLEAFPFLAGEGAEEDARRVLGGASVHAVGRSLPVPPAGRAGVYEAYYTPLRVEDGTVVGGFAIVRDITDQRHAEAQLQESEIRFRTMADGAPVLLWMAGTDSLCNFFNQGWLAFTGRTLEREFGNGWAEGVHPEDFQHCMMVYMSAFVERRDFRMEYRLRRADGEYRWILDAGRPRFSPDGSFEGYIGSCIDITELKESASTLRTLNTELENRVEQRTAELKTANAELESFSYSVSHDLRAPLRAIDGFSKILLESAAGTLDERGKDSLGRVRAATQRMGELIDDLLDLSRLSRGELRLETLNLSLLAQEVAEEFGKTDPGRQVQFVIAPGLAARGDAGLLRVVLDNLMGNAWKFTSKRSSARIEVGRESREGKPAFFVRDNGAGFDPAYGGKLFQVFQRLHHVRDYEGTGIGLATVARIIRRHGGTVWATGEQDK